MFPFLSFLKEQVWALVPAHSNLLPWLCVWLSDFSGELLREAKITDREPWGCLPEVLIPISCSQLTFQTLGFPIPTYSWTWTQTPLSICALRTRCSKLSLKLRSFQPESAYPSSYGQAFTIVVNHRTLHSNRGSRLT